MAITKRSITLAKILTYSGTLPLFATALLIYFTTDGLNFLFVVLTYSSIIISFLSGIHWAVYLFFAEKCPHNLLITSNITALLGWASLLFPNQLITLLLQILCFLYLLMLDLKLRNAGILPQWFYGLRRNATTIVILCLVTLLVIV
ncbi:MAG: DUF3429 domain-containing protein [Alphaproteobacteria bacterium]